MPTLIPTNPSSVGGTAAAAGKTVKFDASGSIQAVNVSAKGSGAGSGGILLLYNTSGSYTASLKGELVTANRTIQCPDESGTMWVQPTTIATAFAAIRKIRSGTADFPLYHIVTGNVSGTTTQGTFVSNALPFLSISAATAGKARMYLNVSGALGAWPSTGTSAGAFVPNYSAPCRVEMKLSVVLSAHTSSVVSVHLCHSNPSTHTSFDRTEKGLSIKFTGGASAGTVKLQAHNGTTTTDSATASYAIGDYAPHDWVLEWEPGVAARLYCDGILKCTLTTGLPSGAGAASATGFAALAENTASGATYATYLRWCSSNIITIPFSS